MPLTFPISHTDFLSPTLKLSPVECAHPPEARERPCLLSLRQPLPSASLGRSSGLLELGRAEGSQACWMVIAVPEGYLSDS